MYDYVDLTPLMLANIVFYVQRNATDTITRSRTYDFTKAAIPHGTSWSFRLFHGASHTLLSQGQVHFS